MIGHGSSNLVNPHVSVDCVLFGYDGEDLKILLVNQIDKLDLQHVLNKKLPGSLIYEDEDLDESASRVLYELTGLTKINLIQFRAFGSKDRTRNSKDTLWLERFHKLSTSIDRIVTIAYMAMVKIDHKLSHLTSQYKACWLPIKEVGDLAFDHNQIILYAISYMQHYVENDPIEFFDLLPAKFTALQLRHLYEVIYNKEFDVRNFHKKIAMMNYIIPLDEYEKGVAHRAARYYKFNRKIYNKQIHKII